MSTKQQPANGIKKEQQRNLYRLLRSAGLEDQKENLVFSYTESRTTHTSEMTEAEAAALISYLGSYAQPDAKAESCNKMRRKIISQAHRMGWQLGEGGQGAAVDMDRVNGWCLFKGYLKKPLSEYTYDELPLLVSQFNEMYKKYLKEIGK